MCDRCMSTSTDSNIIITLLIFCHDVRVSEQQIRFLRSLSDNYTVISQVLQKYKRRLQPNLYFATENSTSTDV